MSDNIQSADDFAFKILEHTDCTVHCPENILKLIESRDAAQRQAGREEVVLDVSHIVKEMDKRYAAVVGAARKADGILNRLASFIYKHDLARHYGLEKTSEALHKALAELDEARKG